MLNCRDIELLLQDYLDGYLLASQREVLEEHIGECPSCGTLLTEMRRLDSELDGMPSVGDPGDLRDRILDALPPPPSTSRGNTRQYVGGLLAAMVVVALGFLVGTRYGMQAGDGFREIEIAFVAPAASSVAVVGDFNDWDPGAHGMERLGENGVWRVKLRLNPGVYEYGFIVDGQDWATDPAAERFLADGFGGENSVLFVEG